MRLALYGGIGTPRGDYLGKEQQVIVEPPAEEVSPTGGWAVYQRYRDAEEVRRQRIALGIIPDDEPEAEAVQEAAKQPAKILARKRLRERVSDANRIGELEAMLDRIMAEIAAEQERAYAQMLDELKAVQAESVNFQRNQNAVAVMAMLAVA